MKINFVFNSESWEIRCVGSVARQYDNNTVEIVFTGDFPAEFSVWNLMIRHDDDFDEFELERNSGRLSRLLDASHLAFAGKHELQLKAIDGTRVKHSDRASFTLDRSMSGDAQWPELPTIFTDAVQAAQQARDDAAGAKTAAEAAKNAAVQAKVDLLNAVASEEEVREILTEDEGGEE